MEKTLIAQLKDKKAQLETALANSLTEKEFDLLDEELRQTNKSLLLAENQDRQRQEADAKAARKKALDEFEQKRGQIKATLDTADQQDKELFAKMEDLYYSFLDVYAQREKAAADTISLQLTARELEVEPPEALIVEMCNTRPGTPGSAEDHLMAFFKQYDLSARALKDAKKNKVAGAPAKPGLNWFFRGHGEFYPRDPEPPSPPKDMYSSDPAKREQAKQEYERILKRAKLRGQATTNTN